MKTYPKTCWRCNGKGYLYEGFDREKCPMCKGRGILQDELKIDEKIVRFK